jgi:hypothetical protein
MRASLTLWVVLAAVFVASVVLVGRAIDNTFQQAGCVVTPGTVVDTNGVCK